jgi:hypothetical protein
MIAVPAVLAGRSASIVQHLTGDAREDAGAPRFFGYATAGSRISRNVTPGAILTAPER